MSPYRTAAPKPAIRICTQFLCLAFLPFKTSRRRHQHARRFRPLTIPRSPNHE